MVSSVLVFVADHHRELGIADGATEACHKMTVRPPYVREYQP